MKTLFSPIKLRDVTFKNRIFVSPMCQYSSHDGLPGDWHLVHLGSRAVGGAALVMVEATAVSPEGRISPWDSGMWSDEHGEAFKRITTFMKDQGCVPGLQLAHAGRKASTDVPWRGDRPLSDSEGGWDPLAPSALPFAPDSRVPHALEREQMEMLASRFVEAAKRSRNAGFDVLELHMAHGYLLHEFLSPISNHREDEFGGSLENRMKFPLSVARAVRAVWPAHLPLFVRISCGFQVPFAASIRKEVGIATGAVGVITSPVQAEQITATGQADVVFLAREMLRHPYWPLDAARSLRVDVPWPEQYQRGKSG
ncbi:MAG: NADH:flavin oxidoreductase/NADH oxidase [Deltaproteobacteria bacterium]